MTDMTDKCRNLIYERGQMPQPVYDQVGVQA